MSKSLKGWVSLRTIEFRFGTILTPLPTLATALVEGGIPDGTSVPPGNK